MHTMRNFLAHALHVRHVCARGIVFVCLQLTINFLQPPLRLLLKGTNPSQCIILIVLKCTVISVIMPPPHFYRKYAPPFSEGSFLKILWWEMPG